jgi:hypothetical protein
MANSAEDGVRGEQASAPEKISVTPDICPVHTRLLNLWLTGEWQCPCCGGPDPLTAARLRYEYSLNPNREETHEHDRHQAPYE